MNGPDGKWLGFGVGDADPDVPRTDPNWHAVSLLLEELHDKYKWAREMGVKPGSVIDETAAAAIAEFQRRAGIPVLLDSSGRGVANLATRARLGSYPPPPPPRHAVLTFSGTWAPPGVGYASDVARACADVVEEVPVQAPWSFGPMPPGPIDSPSYRESVATAVEWSVRWVLDHPERTVLLGGYSQGAEAASRVLVEFQTGRLKHLRTNLVGGYTFGNPSRQDGHTFHADPNPTPGGGISDFQLGDTGDWWIDCAAPGDIYTTCPGGAVGRIMRAAYLLAVAMQVHNFMTFVAAFADHLWALVQAAVVDIPAAFDAAGRGIAFVAAQPPTRPHITYEFEEALPGTTFVQLACQHVRHWAGRSEVGVAA